MTRVDRRALFASGAAAALLAAAGVSLAGTPRRGGHLRIAVPREETGLVPEARAALFETLTELSPEGILKGRLATGWQATDDARTWDLSLRSGVTFHDGSAMTARDVAASLRHAPIGLPQATRIETMGHDRLRVHLSDSDPHFPLRLAGADCIIRPAADSGQTGLVGTGPYRARHLTPGGGLVAVRVDQHYARAQAGWADRVDIVAMSDPATRAEAFAAGAIDAVRLDDASRCAGRDARVLTSPDGQTHLVVRNTVGMPGATSAPDTRLAERFWLI